MPEPRLNPEIKIATIGVKELKEIKVYPLSMADQLRMTNLITEALRMFFKKPESASDIEFAAFLADTIKDNLDEVLRLVTDEGEATLSDITNNQAIGIAEVIYDVNFGSLIKKAKSLLEKAKEQFPSGRPSLTSLGTTEDTDSRTSTEEDGETEESQ